MMSNFIDGARRWVRENTQLIIAVGVFGAFLVSLILLIRDCSQSEEKADLFYWLELRAGQSGTEAAAVQVPVEQLREDLLEGEPASVISSYIEDYFTQSQEWRVSLVISNDGEANAKEVTAFVETAGIVDGFLPSVGTTDCDTTGDGIGTSSIRIRCDRIAAGSGDSPVILTLIISVPRLPVGQAREIAADLVEGDDRLVQHALLLSDLASLAGCGKALVRWDVGLVSGDGLAPPSEGFVVKEHGVDFDGGKGQFRPTRLRILSREPLSEDAPQGVTIVISEPADSTDAGFTYAVDLTKANSFATGFAPLPGVSLFVPSETPDPESFPC